MNAIINGEIVRFSASCEMVEFSVSVSQTVIHDETFTLRTVVDCVVRPTQIELGDCVIRGSHVVLVPHELSEPLRTARCLAVGDKVSVNLKKNEDGTWEVKAINRTPKRGQDVSEYLQCLEEKVKKH